MKTVHRWCEACQKDTQQDFYTAGPDGSHCPAAERVILGMLTFGFHEAVLHKCYKCTRCKTKEIL